MYLPTFAQVLALAAISSVTTALPTEAGKSGSSNAVCKQVGISITRAQEVKAAFDAANLVPEAIKSINPKVELSASYGIKSANLGNVFKVTETINCPPIQFTAEPGYDPTTTKYLILFVDPGAPMPKADGTPALLSFFLHQATYNASPSCINPTNNGGGSDITIPAYRALTPLSTSRHRYVQLVYRQPPGFKRPDELALVTAGFDLNGFVEENGLVNVGAQFFREGVLDV